MILTCNFIPNIYFFNIPLYTYKQGNSIPLNGNITHNSITIKLYITGNLNK